MPGEPCFRLSDGKVPLGHVVGQQGSPWWSDLLCWWWNTSCKLAGSEVLMSDGVDAHLGQPFLQMRVPVVFDLVVCSPR